MIKIHHLSRSFDRIKAVNDLSFEVNRGEIFALLGPNGAGKTTTIKIIMGMLKPDSGEVHLNGAVVTNADVSFRRKIGYVPESSELYDNLTGAEYLEFVGNLFHLDRETIKDRAANLLEILALTKSKNDLIREYSKGMRQKILLISALLHNPEIIILDEPFSGLDANSVAVFKEVLREQAAAGKTVIFCSHILDVVEKLVDRILIIKDGQCLALGTPEEIISQSGYDRLDRAFNKLTGADDIDTQAKSIIDVIVKENNHGSE